MFYYSFIDNVTKVSTPSYNLCDVIYECSLRASSNICIVPVTTFGAFSIGMIRGSTWPTLNSQPLMIVFEAWFNSNLKKLTSLLLSKATALLNKFKFSFKFSMLKIVKRRFYDLSPKHHISAENKVRLDVFWGALCFTTLPLKSTLYNELHFFFFSGLLYFKV